MKNYFLLSKSTWAALLLILLTAAVPMLAQDPASAIGTAAQTMMTGPFALGITIVGIVIGGVMIMFGGGMAMRAIGSIIVGGVLVLDAVKIGTYVQSIF